MFFYYSHWKEYHRQLCADFQTGTFKTVPDKSELFLNDVQTETSYLLFPKNSTKNIYRIFENIIIKLKYAFFT